MKLKIKYGINFEIRRTKNTLTKLDWYLSQGYEVKLPKNISKGISLKSIKEQIEKEYREEDYKIIKNKILSDFLMVEKQFSKKLKEIFNIKIPSIFFIYLTKYGVGGSYDLPNIIFLNINNKRGFKTIAHEIVHIIIEPWIQKYEIRYQEKERIVDLILSSKEFYFLKYDIAQTDYDHSEKYIDELFNKYFFEDPKKFFLEIKNVRIFN
jgi:hypothetical protein